MERRFTTDEIKYEWANYGYKFRSTDGFGTRWDDGEDGDPTTEWRKNVWCDQDGWHLRECHRGLGEGCFWTDWETWDISYMEAIAEFYEWLMI